MSDQVVDLLLTVQQPRRAPITDREPRCWRCRRVLASVVTRPWRMRCAKCRAENASPPPSIGWPGFETK
jgi:hypothetical protein